MKPSPEFIFLTEISSDTTQCRDDAPIDRMFDQRFEDRLAGFFFESSSAFLTSAYSSTPRSGSGAASSSTFCRCCPSSPFAPLPEYPAQVRHATARLGRGETREVMTSRDAGSRRIENVDQGVSLVVMAFLHQLPADLPRRIIAGPSSNLMRSCGRVAPECGSTD